MEGDTRWHRQAYRKSWKVNCNEQRDKSIIYTVLTPYSRIQKGPEKCRTLMPVAERKKKKEEEEKQRFARGIQSQFHSNKNNRLPSLP